MTTIDQLRLKILDRPQLILGEIVGSGNGVTLEFRLARTPAMSGTAVIKSDTVSYVEGIDYTLDCITGRLTFVDPPEEDVRIYADYEFAAFSDDELQAFLDSSGGNFLLAAGSALTSMIADRNRLITWSRGDARIDYGRLRRDLSDVARRFYSQGASESGASITDQVDWEEVV